jgi:staphylococcal nuclease domain-containing protein 1
MLFLVAIVEQVRDGTAIRVRLLLENGQHQFVNLVRLPRLFRPTRWLTGHPDLQALAGVKSPKALSGRDGESNAPSEEWGEEAKFFTESRLLQRAVKVQLLSAPVSLGALPSANAGKASAGGLPAPQSVTSNIMIGTA